ncbi:hypothetical protein V2J09_021645 [Rumex salicifolius]
MEELVLDPCMIPFTKKWLRNAWMPLPTLAITFLVTFAEGLGLPCTDSAIIKMMVACGFSAIGMVNVSNKDGLTSSWKSKIVLVDKRGNYEVFPILNDATYESQPMITGKMPSHIKVPSYLSPSALTIGTKLLFLGSSPQSIITYNVKNGEWGQILLPKPFNSSDLALIECNGRLLLTDVVWNAKRSTISVRIWKLYQRVMMMMLMEIDRMPSSLCSEFEGKVGVTYECLCNKSVILILLKTSRMSRLYTYDVMSQEWSKVPKLSLPNERRMTINSGTRFFSGFTMP